jgi:hypothetical protein
VCENINRQLEEKRIRSGGYFSVKRGSRYKFLLNLGEFKGREMEKTCYKFKS